MSPGPTRVPAGGDGRVASGLFYHFAGGLFGKVLSLAIQAVHLLVLARALGHAGFGEYVLLQGLCTLITCVGTAWSSAFQNTIAESVRQGLDLRCLRPAVRVIALWTTSVFVLLSGAAWAFELPLDSFRMLKAAGPLTGLALWVSTLASSMQMLQVSVLAAEGSPLILARQQTIGKVAALCLSSAFWWAGSKISPAMMLAGVQFAGALPCLFTIVDRIRRAERGTGGVEGATFRRFARFGAINLLATGMRLMELNLVSTLFGAAGAGTFGFLVRVVSPVVTAIASGARNLWPQFQRAEPGELVHVLLRMRKLQWMSVGAVTALAVGTGVLGPLLGKLVQFPDLQNPLLIVLVAFQSVCLAWSAFSYNLFAGLGRETLTFKTLLAQAGVLATGWLMAILTPMPGATVGLLCAGYAVSVAGCWVLETALCRAGGRAEPGPASGPRAG